jgi:lipoate---protein ligase
MSLDGHWRLLDLSYPSPHLNLALEEALARSNSSLGIPTIRTWTNRLAAVVGRFQEVSSEVDVDLCQQNRIEICRRFTGGGTVFHDKGNLNLTIVTPRQDGMSLGKMNEMNCALILNLLDELGVPSEFVSPNSIEISGRKVSGAAAALGRDFAFWHASILVSTDIALLNRVLRPGKVANSSKFIRSRCRPVVSLENALGKRTELEDVKRRLVRVCTRSYEARVEVGELSKEEKNVMETLHAGKYRTASWNLQGIVS